MFSLKSLIVVLVLMGFFGQHEAYSPPPPPPSLLDKVLMSGSDHFTQNYSLQNKSSPKQTNKELLNCHFELIPLKTNWQKRLLNTTEASLRANSPFRKRSHKRAACERRHGCEGWVKGRSLSPFHPPLAASPLGSAFSCATRNSRTQGLISWFMLF